MTAPGPIVATERRDAVAIAHLNRAETRNALDPDLMEALAGVVEGWDRDPDVRCIVIAGTDRVFASGGMGAEGPVHAGADLWERLAACRTPLVAAVSGYAIGGGFELALLCDMIVAADNAEFGQPEIQLGLIPGAGATQRLTRTLGKHRTMELVLTGKRITAQEAHDAGLVNRVTGKRAWFEAAVELAAVVAVRAPVAAQLAKEAVLAAAAGLEAGLARERELYERALATEDRVEGVQAFAEGRRPEFRGR